MTWPALLADFEAGRLRPFYTYLTLVSPPAILYAIPVERFVDLKRAQATNAWFLGIVAAWRVGLLFFYLKRYARFRVYEVVIVGLLPLAAIVTALFALNLHHVTLDFMGGFRDPSPHDEAYFVVFLLTVLSVYAAIPLLLAYLVTWRRRLAAHTRPESVPEQKNPSGGQDPHV